jgi:anthranilate/para-aminobenzoate synthase component II
VQFHPESILTADGDLGLALIGNVLASTRRRLCN